MALTKVTTGGIKDGTITNEDISTTTSISQDKLAATPGASSSASGLMIPADKNKLDGVADNANNYSHPSAHTVSEVTGLQGLLDGKTTETYVNTQITNVIGAAPAALDTLTELAAALGDDANYAATVTTALAGKVDDSQVLTNVPSGALFTDTNTTYSVGDGGLTQVNFTTADNTKLDGIEAGANVTDTANVTAAGALMDSEVTNLAQVKAFDTTDYATAAQGATADAALPKAGGTMTGDVSLGDNVKAKFGASDDLEIYHSGADSYIVDAGVGDLYIRASNEIRVQDGNQSNFLYAVEGGDIRLYHAGSQKLATTATGIDVTGSVTANSFSGKSSSRLDISSGIGMRHATPYITRGNGGYAESGSRYFQSPYFTNGIGNQGVDIIMPANSFWTSGTIILSAAYSHQNQAGRRKYEFTYNHNSAGNYGETWSLDGVNNTGTSSFAVTPWAWDSTNNWHVLKIRKSNTYGNSIGVRVDLDQAAHDYLPNMYMTSLYTY